MKKNVKTKEEKEFTIIDAVEKYIERLERDHEVEIYYNIDRIKHG